MAFDAFVVFTKGSGTALPTFGETLDTMFKAAKAFEISEFSFGAENTLSIGSATGGAGAGKATFKEFTIKKLTDTGSTSLFQSCVTGGHYQKVYLFLRKSGQDAMTSGGVYMKFAFGTVAVKSITWSGSSGDDMPTEEVVFEYGQIAINYTQQLQTGQVTGATTIASWNRVNNTADIADPLGTTTIPIVASNA
jgi:type VI secretion system secreted protein Hcp